MGIVVRSTAKRSGAPAFCLAAFDFAAFAFDFGRAFALAFRFAFAITAPKREKPAEVRRSEAGILPTPRVVANPSGRHLIPARNTKKPCRSHAFTAMQR